MAHKHPVYDTDKHFVIDPTTKRISTECPKVVLPQHSHRSERFTFEIPKKEVEGHDMSLCNLVEVHFQNIDAANKENKSFGVCKVEDLNAEGDTVYCSWLIEGDSTYYAGGLIFALHFACLSDAGEIEYNFPTLSYSAITVGQTVWNNDTIAKQYPDIIKDFESRISKLEKNGTGGAVSNEQIEQVVTDYLSRKPIASIGYVEILASKWVGDKSPYSQVVNVPGATANSQVDLTPDVEQLSTFYNKDLSFVTVNDGGVVTVYAIGQKPQNDYTIQVTITEVAK